MRGCSVPRRPLNFGERPQTTSITSTKPRRLRVVSARVGQHRGEPIVVDDGAKTERKSEEYTDVMQHRMGTVLTYRHEDGMNYHRILDNLVVGSCLQTPMDVDRLVEKESVATILCLQENSDMEYFSLDILPIRARCKERSDVQHLRHAIRDFDPFSLRRRLPGAVALLAQGSLPGTGIQGAQNGAKGKVMYVHCTAGLGRAPATALAYMWWVLGIPLNEAYAQLTSIRPCKPNTDAIRAATVDILFGQRLTPVTITLNRRGTAQKVKVAGLDVGWGQSLDLTPDGHTKRLVITRNLPPGNYEYKFIWDDEVWGPCMDHLLKMNGDNLNNFITVPDEDLGQEVEEARARLRSPDGDLTLQEREVIMQKLQAMVVDGNSESAPTGEDVI
jgi:hypothetical protein